MAVGDMDGRPAPLFLVAKATGPHVLGDWAPRLSLEGRRTGTERGDVTGSQQNNLDRGHSSSCQKCVLERLPLGLGIPGAHRAGTAIAGLVFCVSGGRGRGGSEGRGDPGSTDPTAPFRPPRTGAPWGHHERSGRGRADLPGAPLPRAQCPGRTLSPVPAGRNQRPLPSPGPCTPCPSLTDPPSGLWGGVAAGPRGPRGRPRPTRSCRRCAPAGAPRGLPPRLLRRTRVWGRASLLTGTARSVRTMGTTESHVKLNLRTRVLRWAPES